MTPDAVALTRSWGGDDLTAIGTQLADLLAADPWATRLPVVLAGVPVPPPPAGGPWQLRDAGGRSVPLVEGAGRPVAAGRPVRR